MRTPGHTALSLLLCGVLALSSVATLTACNDTTTPPADTSASTTPDTAPETTPGDAALTYSVIVKNQDDTPAAGIVVRLKKPDGTDAGMNLAGPTGAAAFSLPAGDYTVSLEAQDGSTFYYEPTTLSADETTADIRICKKATQTEKIMAPSLKVTTGEFVKTDAYIFGEGTYYVELSSEDYTYFLFDPTRGGVFSIAAPETVDLSYHGMAISMMSQVMIAPTDGKIALEIEASSVGGGSVSQQVFRLKSPEGATEIPAGVMVTISRTGDIVKSPEEMATYTIIEANPDALVPYTGDTSGTLTNVDVTNLDLTVVMGSDGYYHYGSATGPVVFLRIASENPYTQSFEKMCETDRIRAHFYDENGKFLRKEGYSQLILDYAEVANDDGLVPLNTQLAYVLQSAGQYMGWWDFENNRDVFGDIVVPVETAWLFACAYYRPAPSAGAN